MKYFHLIYFLFSVTTSIAQSKLNNAICFDNFSSNEANFLSNEAFLKARAIFIGNKHGVSGDYNIFYRILEVLSARKGTRFIMLERSYGDAYLLNKYLETGDEKFLKYDLEASDDMTFALRSIFQINKKLDVNKKIMFLGIDGAQYLTPIVLSLKELIPAETEAPLVIKEFIDSLRKIEIPLKKLKTYASRAERLKDVESDLEFLRNEILANKKVYEDYFDQNFIHVMQIISNEATLLKENRNSDMYKNALRMSEAFNIKDGVLGIFGASHVNKNSSRSLAGLFQNNHKSPFLNSVYFVRIAYKNCQSAFSPETIYDKEVFKEIDKLKIDFFKNECTHQVINIGEDKNVWQLKKQFDCLILVSNQKGLSLVK